MDRFVPIQHARCRHLDMLLDRYAAEDGTDGQGRVAALLPLGSTVVHAYEGAHLEEFTGQCEITHVRQPNNLGRIPDTPPNVQVRWLRGYPGL